MAYISLEDAKRHLRIDFETDDRYVNELIDVAEATLEQQLGITLGDLILSGSLTDLPSDLKHATRLLVSNYYENREPVTGINVKEVPFSLQYLITPHKYWYV